MDDDDDLHSLDDDGLSDSSLPPPDMPMHDQSNDEHDMELEHEHDELDEMEDDEEAVDDDDGFQDVSLDEVTERLRCLIALSGMPGAHSCAEVPLTTSLTACVGRSLADLLTAISNTLGQLMDDDFVPDPASVLRLLLGMPEDLFFVVQVPSLLALLAPHMTSSSASAPREKSSRASGRQAKMRSSALLGCTLWTTLTAASSRSIIYPTFSRPSPVRGCDPGVALRG